MSIENLNNFENNAVLLINQNETDIATLQTDSGTNTTDIVTLEGYFGSMTAGAGITGGTGTIAKTTIANDASFFHTKMILDLTGLHSTAAADIIGIDGTAEVCHLGQVTAAANGTVIAGRITCMEAAAGGGVDIDVYSATEGTGVEEGDIASLTSTQLINAGQLSLGGVGIFTALPAADSYLYLVNQSATDADYTGGIFLIELFGYA